MGLFKRKKAKRTDYFEATVHANWKVDITRHEDALYFLIDLFQRVRSSKLSFSSQAENKMQELISQLYTSPDLLHNVQSALISQLVNTNLEPALTQSGLMQSQAFMQELGRRVNYKFLPPLQDPNDFLYVVNHVFYKSRDYQWVEAIERDTWIAFFKAVGFPEEHNNRKLQLQFARSLILLSYRVANTGLDPQLTAYLPENIHADNNPFVLQNVICTELVNLLQEDGDSAQLERDELTKIAALDDMLLASLTTLKEIQGYQSSNGASIALTYNTLIIESSIVRMRLLLETSNVKHTFQIAKFVDFFRMLVRNENRKTSIRELFSQAFGYVAYQIAEHKGDKGEKYITTTRKGWFKMTYTAAWGGVIICFVAVFKVLLHLLPVPPFWQGIAYSVNYSAGFVAIEETHSTLATKQPAFTASALASSLDTKKTNGQPNLYSLAVTVARTLRSQNASFIGNLMIVIPGSYFLAWAYDKLFGHKLVDGLHAYATLQDQHPWYSLSLLYAANAGVFLFVTGLLAGYVGNKMKYEKVAERIQQHPVLNLTMSKKRLARLGHYIEHHGGALAGNIAFGFLMGMGGVVTQIFGIKFDVRHVTIAAANASMGVYGLGWSRLPIKYILSLCLGIFGIGFVNFAVSFSLAFMVALRSRGLRIKDFPELFRIVWHYFRKHPLRFLFPGKDVKGES